MTADKFVIYASQCGYANRSMAKAWCDENPKDDYTDEDLIEVYRYAQRPRRGGYTSGMRPMPGGGRTTINNVHRGLNES